MTIGVVTLMVASAGTFAVFTDQEVASGTLTAGTVTITAVGTNTNLGFSTDTDCTPVIPSAGATCSASVTVTNTGTLPVTIAATAILNATIDTLHDCDGGTNVAINGGSSTLTITDNTLDEAGGADTTEVITFDVVVSSLDDNACQGATAQIDVTVDATEA